MPGESDVGPIKDDRNAESAATLARCPILVIRSGSRLAAAMYGIYRSSPMRMFRNRVIRVGRRAMLVAMHAERRVGCRRRQKHQCADDRKV